MRKIREISQQLSDTLGLPPELPPGSASVSITGGRHALVEGHRGIAEYSRERLVLNIRGGRLIISGSELILRAMNTSELAVSGRIDSAQWQQHE